MDRKFVKITCEINSESYSNIGRPECYGHNLKKGQIYEVIGKHKDDNDFIVIGILDGGHDINFYKTTNNHFKDFCIFNGNEKGYKGLVFINSYEYISHNLATSKLFKLTYDVKYKESNI